MKMTTLKLYYSEWGNGTFTNDNNEPAKALLMAGTIPRTLAIGTNPSRQEYKSEALRRAPTSNSTSSDISRKWPPLAAVLCYDTNQHSLLFGLKGKPSMAFRQSSAVRLINS